MKEFTITWEVRYYDYEPERVYYSQETIEHETLDSLKEYLGENSVDHTPEKECPYEDGDFNIEWIAIHDTNTSKELWRDEDVITPDWLNEEGVWSNYNAEDLS